MTEACGTIQYKGDEEDGRRPRFWCESLLRTLPFRKREAAGSVQNKRMKSFN